MQPVHLVDWRAPAPIGATPFSDEDQLDRALLEQPAAWSCFPSAWHFEAWRRLAPRTIPPCTDCSPAYRDAMVRQGRCRHPGVVFDLADGELVGKVPTPEGFSRSGSRSNVDPAASAFSVILACRFLGVDAVALLTGISSASLPHYRNGSRRLPPAKFLALQVALRAAARLVVRS